MDHQKGRIYLRSEILGKGGLSIVVQGPLTTDNSVRVANHCRHWRALVPEAEIILAVSSGNVLSSDRTLRTEDADAGRAVHVLSEVCDQLVFAAQSLPLESIKFGGNANNANLQIEGAQIGLRAASNRYCLRIRSDLLLMTTGFIDFYCNNFQRATLTDRMFEQRILIPSLFTLNPYTFERLPFHFSDWFHFGLTADVRAFWNVPPVELTDARFYDWNPHVEHSNPEERRFRSRYGVEQHIAFQFFSRHDGRLRLSYHNDLTDRERSLDLLMSNFIIADPARCKLIFDKYQHVITHPYSSALCITSDDWFYYTSSTFKEKYVEYFDHKMDRLGRFPTGYQALEREKRRRLFPPKLRR